MSDIYLFVGVYCLFEATGVRPNTSAIMISPWIPQADEDRCLHFSFHARGPDVGRLLIVDEFDEAMWSYDASQTTNEDGNLTA